jgi:hypothetical protein
MAATKEKPLRKNKKTQAVKPKLDERFIITIKGKDFVLYSGLLDLAHQHGLQRLSVEPIQYPTNENGHEAICRAVAESKDGEVFSDIGDANSSNVNAAISLHILRVASTRAKARVLRDMVNIGMTALEELGGLDEQIGNEIPKPGANGNGNGNGNKHEDQEEKAAKGKGNGSKQGKRETAGKQKEPKPEPSKPCKSEEQAPKSEAKGNGNGNGKTPKMSEAQKRAIHNLSQRRGISSEELEAMALKIYNTSLECLSAQDASFLIRELQAA